eukprot:4725196-Amphidinium_carterae.1
MLSGCINARRAPLRVGYSGVSLRCHRNNYQAQVLQSDMELKQELRREFGIDWDCHYLYHMPDACDKNSATAILSLRDANIGSMELKMVSRRSLKENVCIH